VEVVAEAAGMGAEVTATAEGTAEVTVVVLEAVPPPAGSESVVPPGPVLAVRPAGLPQPESESVAPPGPVLVALPPALPRAESESVVPRA